MKILNIDKLHENFKKRNERDIARGTITCSQIIINQCGKRVYQAEFGTNGVAGKALDHNATFRIASMTKPVTAFAILLEAEKGRVDLQAPITQYLPGYENLPIARLVDGKLQVTGQSKTPIRVFHYSRTRAGWKWGIS